MVKTGSRKYAEHGWNCPYPSLGVPGGGQGWLGCALQLLWEQSTFPSAEDTGGLNVSWGMGMRGGCHLVCSLLPAQGAF